MVDLVIVLKNVDIDLPETPPPLWTKSIKMYFFGTSLIDI